MVCIYIYYVDNMEHFSDITSVFAAAYVGQLLFWSSEFKIRMKGSKHRVDKCNIMGPFEHMGECTHKDEHTLSGTLHQHQIFYTK